jgi:hypothetical protein
MEGYLTELSALVESVERLRKGKVVRAFLHVVVEGALLRDGK